MQSKVSQRIVSGVFTRLDDQIWNGVAQKAVSKMPKYKLANQTQRMLADFTILNSQQNLQSAGELSEQRQQNKTIKQTLLVGVHKVVSAEKSIHHRTTHSIINQQHSNHFDHKRNKKRLTSAIELNNHKNTENKGNLFRLTNTDSNEQQQKIDENLRSTKYDNIRYNQFMEQTQRQKRNQSEYRSLIQKKRLKQMKIFTYDYQGKIVSQGNNQKSKNSGIHIIAMRPQFGNHAKTNRASSHRIAKNEKILEIINKKIINQPPPAEPIKETDKQKEQKQKLAKIIKTLQHPPPNKFECFKEENRISAGVTITDLNNKSVFIGKVKQKFQGQQIRLKEFKGQFRQRQPYEKLKFKKLKLRQGQNLGYRTEYHEQGSNFRRLKTEATEKQSKAYTQSAYSKRRGRIDINNQRLYTQNFIEDLQ